jgi:hypothetical protein
MTAIARRSIRTLVALGVCTLTPVLLVSFRTSATSSNSTARDSSCTELREWARQFEGTTPTLETLARYDRAHRLAIFTVATPEVRSALWREQLRRVAQQSEWSAQQRALITEAIELATPAMYTKNPVAREAAVKYWTRAQPVFPAGEQRRLLFEIGGPTPRPGATVVKPTLWDRMTTPFRASAAGGPPCECSIMWQDCVWCVTGHCWWRMDGCGPYGWFECDGVCEWPGT